MNKQLLLDYYNIFNTNYNKHLQNILLKRSDESRQDIQKLRRTLIGDALNVARKGSKVAELLGHICGHFSYIDAESTYGEVGQIELPYIVQIHPTQVLAIFMLLEIDEVHSNGTHNQLVQVLTGEGKSMVLAIVATLYALLGETVKVCYDNCCYEIHSLLISMF